MAVTPQTNCSLAEIAELLRELDDFVICGHVSPDGDCLGSQLALWHALRALGKRATCVLVRDEPVDDANAFMPGAADMLPAERFSGAARVFVGVDVPTRERVEAAACAILDSCETSATIDHHASDVAMCEHVYVDPDAASASMLVWEVVKMLCAEPPLEAAVCAYTGLVTDTGGFCFQNSDARAFRTASELVERGVNPAEVARHAFQSRTMASLLLEELVINRMRLICDGQAAVSWLSQADFEALGAVKADAENMIDTLRSLKTVRVACMLREQDGVVRGSLRSKDETDVSALAARLGGGGHRAAAGFTLRMGLSQAVAFMEEEVAALVAARGGACA